MINMCNCLRVFLRLGVNVDKNLNGKVCDLLLVTNINISGAYLTIRLPSRHISIYFCVEYCMQLQLYKQYFPSNEHFENVHIY